MGNRICLIRTYAHISTMNGAYLLVMELPRHTSITIGKQGEINFEKGWYVYVGSAMNGLDQRIQRHLRAYKKIHWHIDYLLPFTNSIAVFYKEHNIREECAIAHCFESHYRIIPGFGCSDCNCQSHLFSGPFEDISRTARDLGMRPYSLHTNP